MANYGLVLVTAPSEAEAGAIAEALIQSKLAACVTLLPVKSIYTWQDQIHREQEWQLLIKSDLDLFELLAEKVKTLHSFEVPEILAIPIVAGSEHYLSWISSQLIAS